MTVESTFNVGEQYENRKGIYEVLSINGPNMVIRWDSGEQIETDIKGQAKVLRNMQREIEEEMAKYHRSPAWYGDEFTGLQEQDFSQDVTGTRWRARESLGGLVAKNIAAEDLEFNSWAIYGSPIIQWADIKRYHRKDSHYQAKFMGRMWEDDFWAGLIIERSEKPDESRDDWNAFMLWLKENEAELKTIIEQHQMSIRDPYRTWDGVFSGIVTASSNQWFYQKTKDTAPVVVNSLHDILAGIGNETWLDLFIAKVYSKEAAIERGRNLGVDVGELLSALVATYKGATPSGIDR